MQAISKLQGKTITQFLWDEMTERMNQNYDKGTLAQFINGEEVTRAPLIEDSFEQQRIKFMKMPLKNLEEYEKELLQHIKIFKNELRSKKNA